MLKHAKDLLTECDELLQRIDDDDIKILVKGQLGIIHMLQDLIVHCLSDAETYLIEC
jgi:hypothetical protein